MEPNSIYTLTTGNYDPNSSAEIIINLPANASALNQLFINPNPLTDPTATQAGKFDLLSVFRHELAHGLGFTGLRNPADRRPRNQCVAVRHRHTVDAEPQATR